MSSTGLILFKLKKSQTQVIGRSSFLEAVESENSIDFSTGREIQFVIQIPHHGIEIRSIRFFQFRAVKEFVRLGRLIIEDQYCGQLLQEGDFVRAFVDKFTKVADRSGEVVGSKGNFGGSQSEASQTGIQVGSPDEGGQDRGCNFFLGFSG